MAKSRDARLCAVAGWAALVVFGASACATNGGADPFQNGGIVVPQPFTSSQKLGGGGDDAAAFWQLDSKLDRRFAKAQRLGDNRFRYELRGFEKVAQKQMSEETCWAACAAMILRMRRDEVDERFLAELIRGGSEDRSATVDGITRALAYRNEKKLENSLLRSSITPKPLTNEDAITAISRNQPFLIGIKETEEGDMGHALVAVAVEFRRLREGMLQKQPWQVVAIDAYDPYPDAPDLRRLEHAEILEKLQFTITRESAEAAVREWSRGRN